MNFKIFMIKAIYVLIILIICCIIYIKVKSKENSLGYMIITTIIGTIFASAVLPSNISVFDYIFDTMFTEESNSSNEQLPTTEPPVTSLGETKNDIDETTQTEETDLTKTPIEESAAQESKEETTEKAKEESIQPTTVPETTQTPIKNGWDFDEDGNWRWYYPDGTMFQTGWLDDGEWYYIKNGIMVTGWHVIDEKYYFFHYDTGAMLKNTWIDGYCLSPDGHRYINTVEIVDGVEYCFDSEGNAWPTENNINIPIQPPTDNFSAGQPGMGECYESTLSFSDDTGMMIEPDEYDMFLLDGCITSNYCLLWCEFVYNTPEKNWPAEKIDFQDDTYKFYLDDLNGIINTYTLDYGYDYIGDFCLTITAKDASGKSVSTVLSWSYYGD